MSQQELLRRVIEVLEQCGIEYMLTGSVASSLQGEPRSTHDVDVVVAMGLSHVGPLLAAFPPPDYYLSESSVKGAISSQSMFNLLSTREGDKIDFWLLTDTPFDKSRFSRRCIETVLGTDMCVSAPEDTILAKLEWARKSGGSEKQFVDALRVYEVQHPFLDHEYLERWAARLEIQDLLERVQAEAQLP